MRTGTTYIQHVQRILLSPHECGLYRHWSVAPANQFPAIPACKLDSVSKILLLVGKATGLVEEELRNHESLMMADFIQGLLE